MTKKNLILGIILACLLVVAYVYQGPFKDWKITAGKPKNFLSGIDAEKIDKIEIDKNKETLLLTKESKGWKIGGTKDFYVSPDTAKSMIDKIKQASELDVVVASQDKEKKISFHTDEDSGIKVKFMEGEKVLADFIVGKTTGDLLSTYISKPELEKTYLVSLNINNVFSREDWYDRAIFSMDSTKISKIRFQYPTREFTIEKKTEGDKAEWKGTLPHEFPVSENKIAEVVNTIASLSAAMIPEQTFKGTGLEKNLIIVQVAGDGIDNTLMIGEADKDGNYYTKKGDSDNIYLISKEQRDILDKQIEQLK